MSSPTDPLIALRDQSRDEWERTLTEIALRALRDGGPDGVRTLEEFLKTRKVDDLYRRLPLRDASEILANLQNAEADRLQRSRDLLRKILAVAAAVSEELLKIALGEKL